MSSVQLLHGDCLALLPTLAAGSVDAVVTDPPYGMNWNTDARRFTGGEGRHRANRKTVIGDHRPFDPQPWLEFQHVILWGSNHYANRLPIGTALVWQKKAADKFGAMLSDAEIAWKSGGHGVYLFRCIWDGCARESEHGEHWHPTQKPVALMRWCLSFLPKGCTVFDPYMGSGSTGVACVQTGHPFIGCEIDPAYFAIAERRIAEAQYIPPLYAAAEKAATLFAEDEAQ